INISWSPNKEKYVAGYKVYYGNSSRNYSNNVDVGTWTNYTIFNLVEGKTYFIGITAYCSNGNESGYSDEISHVASTPASNSSPLPMVGKQKTSQTKSVKDNFVYATKHSRIVHLPSCERLISASATESETVKASNFKIDASNRQIAEIEKQISKLRERYFDIHPKIVQRKNQINCLKKQIEDESVKNVNEEKTGKKPGADNLPETENVIEFLSLEEALKCGGIACPVCRP
ncbi:MAG: hypothetical protein GY941_09730, partial [Planctomycetes bacterium]|nr:hypothetical protein [Planctomycetota bacterium]